MTLVVTGPEHLELDRLARHADELGEIVLLGEGDDARFQWCGADALAALTLQENCHFAIPIDSNLNPLSDMRPFSPVYFGSLRLAFAMRMGASIPKCFVGTLTNSPAANRRHKLHFFNVAGRRDDELYSSLATAVREQTEPKRRIFRPWSENLLPYIEDPHGPDIVKSLDDMVFVKDRYPKARLHYLCIPRRRIDTWRDLTPADIPLLWRMLEEAKTFARETDAEAEYQYGFHVVPSMKYARDGDCTCNSFYRQLHLHIISRDFDSRTLTTKAQWHAFTTGFLVTVDVVIAELEERGSIVVDNARQTHFLSLLKLPLRCVLCDRIMRNMPALKAHYVKEYRDRRDASTAMSVSKEAIKHDF